MRISHTFAEIHIFGKVNYLEASKSANDLGLLLPSLLVEEGKEEDGGAGGGAGWPRFRVVGCSFFRSIVVVILHWRKSGFDTCAVLYVQYAIPKSVSELIALFSLAKQ